jgi:hypothetical protein
MAGPQVSTGSGPWALSLALLILMLLIVTVCVKCEHAHTSKLTEDEGAGGDVKFGDLWPML